MSVRASTPPRTPAHLLRTHVTKRADEIPRSSQVVVLLRKSSQAEVGDPKVATSVDQEIRRLDVAVDHADFMRVLERKCSLQTKLRGHFEVMPVIRERAARLGRRQQRLAVRPAGPIVRGRGVSEGIAPRRRPKFPDDFGQGPSIDKLHRIIMDPLVTADAEYRYDVLVMQ